MLRAAIVALLLMTSAPAWAGSWRGFSFGAGGTLGFDPVLQLVSASPMLSLGFELGGPNVRGWFGLDSAPWFVSAVGYDYGAPTIALLNLGLSGGSERIRVGGHIMFGVVGYGAGAQVRYLPWVGSKGGRHGFEFRAEWFWMLSARAVVMYTFRAPFEGAQ